MSSDAESRGRRRVLLVEDEPLIAMFAGQVLSDAGHETVGPVGTADAALALLARGRIDAAVLDLSLGRSATSIPVAERLIELGIPFVFATGHSDSAVPEAHRGRPRLAKPFTDGQLAAMVAGLLGGGAG